MTSDIIQAAIGARLLLVTNARLHKRDIVITADEAEIVAHLLQAVDAYGRLGYSAGRYERMHNTALALAEAITHRGDRSTP